MANKDRLNIQSATEKLTIPQLIIHGDNDTSINIKEAEELHQWNPKSKLKIIKGANHVFNTKHPWNSNNLSPELETVVKQIVSFY